MRGRTGLAVTEEPPIRAYWRRPGVPARCGVLTRLSTGGNPSDAASDIFIMDDAAKSDLPRGLSPPRLSRAGTDTCWSDYWGP